MSVSVCERARESSLAPQTDLYKYEYAMQEAVEDEVATLLPAPPPVVSRKAVRVPVAAFFPHCRRPTLVQRTNARAAECDDGGGAPRLGDLRTAAASGESCANVMERLRD